MIRLLIILIFLILIKQSVISQNVYPRKAIIDGDTVCIVSIKQANTLDKVFVKRDECNEIKDSLNSQLKNYSNLVEEQKNIINSQDKELILEKKIVAEKDTIITTDKKMLNKQGLKTTLIKIERDILEGVVICLGGYTAYLRIKQ